MSKRLNHYSDSFKLQVLGDYFATGRHVMLTAKKWGVPPTCIYDWFNVTCKNEKKLVSLQSETDKGIVMESSESTIQSLAQQVSDLRKSLEYERMRVTAYERLIEIVKREDGIDVLKKGGAKQ